MIISNSIPIQFWPLSQKTFNERQSPPGIYKPCYCQPFSSYHNIILQVQNDALPKLKVYDITNSLILQKDFSLVSTGYYEVVLLPYTEINAYIGEQIKLIISSGDIDYLKSDCIDLVKIIGSAFSDGFSDGFN